MAKKDLSNLDYADKLKGGGAANILGARKNEVTEVETVVTKEKEEKTKLIKTFEIFSNDYAYLQRYARIMASKNDSKYPLREALADAVKLLQEKNPDIPVD